MNRKDLMTGNTYRRIDITGKKFGEWTVIRHSYNTKWICRCSCGTEKEVDGRSLRSGQSESCRSCSKKKTIIGLKFGHLLVLSLKKATDFLV